MALSGLNERLIKYNEGLFFGQWRLDGATPDDALLGRGSFGRVYSVYREEKDSAGRMCRYSAAIKVIPIDEETICRGSNMSRERKQARLEEELRIVQREIEVMKRLEGESNIAYFQNSQIIKRTDTELNSWDVLICMEKLIVLRRYLQDAGLAPGSYPYMMRVLFIWKEIGAALCVCEKNAILHTDVKPDNVFYAPGPDHFKLSDFGTSITSTTFKSGIRYGTIDYMAPEMFYRQGGDSRVDIYSLAVMIYELFNGGRLPLQQGDRREDRDNACKLRLDELKPVPPLKSIPADVNEVLMRCLDSDPKRRFARCSDAADAAMELYLKYNKKRPDTVSQRGGKWITPVLIGALAVGALGAGAAVVIGLSDHTAQPPAVTVNAVTETPVPDLPTATIVPVTETPEATATPVPALLTLTFDSPDENVFVEGESVSVSGRISVAQGDVDLSELVLYADGREWEMDVTSDEDGDGCAFRAELMLDRSGQFELDLAIRTRGAEDNLASGALRFAAVTPTPEIVLTPTPAPVLALRLDDDKVEAGTGEVTLRGSVLVQGEMPAEELVISINGSGARTEWQPSEGGYAFTASLDMDLADLSELEVRVRALGNADVEAVQTVLPVTTPAPTPEPTKEVYAPIVLENRDAADGRWFSQDDVVSIVGRAQPGKVLNVSVNGSIIGNVTVESDGRFGVEILSGSLSEGENHILMAYAQIENPEWTAELTVGLDTMAPEFSSPAEIDQFTAELRVDIQDRDGACMAELSVDGQPVIAAQAQDGVAVLGPIDQLPLNNASDIVISVTDSVGHTVAQSVRFSRVLQEIQAAYQCQNPAAQERLFYYGSDCALVGSAEPGAMLSIGIGDHEATIEVDGAGQFAWLVEESMLAEGENPYVIRYASYYGAPVENSAEVRGLLKRDTASPVIAEAPRQLAGDERTLGVRISGEEVWSAVLIVNDEAVDAQAAEGDVSVTLTIPDGVALDRTTKIEILAADLSGNAASVPVGYVRLQPLGLIAAEGVWGAYSDGLLTVTGEEGAQVNVLLGNGADFTASLSGTVGAIYIKDSLQRGVNVIHVEYAAENGYPEKALANTGADIIVEYAPDSPDTTVSETLITRDTTELVLTTGNEPYGYRVKLCADGTVLWMQEGVYEGTVVIGGIDQMKLNEGMRLEVVVEDDRNDPTVIPLTYQNTSNSVEAFAIFGEADLGIAGAGGSAALDCVVLCSRYDMTEGYVVMYLVGEDGVKRSCRFAREEVTGVSIEEMAAQVPAQLNSYVDSVYRITGASIPEDCPNGSYALMLSIDTANDDYDYRLGTLTVDTGAAGSSVSLPGVYPDQGYALCFDELIQPEFRSDNVVLTGWTSRETGMPAYFDRCVLLDAYGRQVMSIPIGTEELSQYPRVGLPEVGLVLTQAATDDAGFLLRLNLSDAALADGQYELQLLSANAIGEDWAVVTAKLLINSAAPTVDEEALALFIEQWNPIEPEVTETPVP